MADGDTPQQLELTTPAAPPAPAPAPAIDQMRAEFKQQFGTLDDRLNTVVQYIASKEQQQAPPPPQSQTPSQDPMDQLWSRAQQGDKQAFDQWVTTRTQQTMAQQQAVQNDEAITDGQLRILLQRYPSLNDATNPLTQAANLAFQLMTRNGKPANKATLLDAAKTAIADRPDLVAQMHASTARESSRRGATNRQGQMGAGYRDAEPGQLPAGRKLGLSRESWELAKRMGIPSPERALKAKQNFLKRQEDGQSSLGAVAAFVREDEF